MADFNETQANGLDRQTDSIFWVSMGMNKFLKSESVREKFLVENRLNFFTALTFLHPAPCFWFTVLVFFHPR